MNSVHNVILELKITLVLVFKLLAIALFKLAIALFKLTSFSDAVKTRFLIKTDVRCLTYYLRMLMTNSKNKKL
jgi:hypothetical protein